MKHIIAGFFTIIILAAMGYVASQGGPYNGGEHGKVIKDIKQTQTANSSFVPEEKSDREKEQKELNALRDKAGNVGGFKVSDEYKRKCASCHGVDGSGMQYGKKLMGPKLFGQSEEEIYKKLVDFKSGRKENMIMKGLLINLSEEDLKRFAKEIGEFPARAEALKNK
ncbi:MAG: c-type cytochrome [Epsilonproteobacteria bacterium]|nr:c-type cytochrome [Campylobacterota bacterium]